MERKKFRFEILLEMLFGNFGKILLTNLIFAVPSLAFMALFYFISMAVFGNANIVFCLLSIILIYPFYAGVVKVMRNIVRGDEEIPVFQTYLSGVKDNFWLFLLHGVFISFVSIVSFLSINLYINFVSKSWIFGALLFFSIIVVIFVYFASLYIPLMTVTFDLPIRYIYKNSFLMSYGEIKNNFFASFALLILIGIIMTIMFVAGSPLWLLIIVIALWVLILPATYTFIYVFYIYDAMFKMVSGEGKQKAEKAAKQETDKPKSPVVESDDLASIDISKLKDSDDYIFFNGKMVKQSTLLKMAREKEQSSDEVIENE